MQSPARNSDGSARTLPPGPADLAGRTLTLRYADFGPQAAAAQLLGPQWWQWRAGGSWERGDSFEIPVVVYRGLTEAEVRARFPTVPERSDFRLVPYDAAIAYLDATESSLTDAEGPLVPLRAELARTRARIVAALPHP